MISIAEIRRQL